MRRPSSVREGATFLVGLGLTVVGLVAKPRDTALIVTGIGLMTATPAVAPKSKEDSNP